MSFILNNTGLGRVTLKAGADGNVTFTFPSSNGSGGQYLQTNGDGVLSWASVENTLSGMSDVAIGSAEAGNFLRFDGENWVNVAPTPDMVGAQPVNATLTSLSDLGDVGFVYHTQDGAVVAGSINGTEGQVVVSGTNGNLNISLDDVGTAVANAFVKLTTDAKGRVTGTAAVTTADVTSLVDSVYVNVAGDTMSGFLTLNDNPTDAYHAATKQYVDNAIQGLDAKQSVRYTTNGDLDALAATSEIPGQGDGTYQLNTGDRVLVKDQSNAAENGIYVFNGTGLERAEDFNDWSEVPGAFVFVESDNTGWVCTSDQGGTFGNTEVTFAQFSGAGSYTAGTGLDLYGTEFSLSVVDSELPGSSYATVSVDQYGRVVAGSETQEWSTITGTPTTLSGYGITDALTTSQSLAVTGDVSGSAVLSDGTLQLTLANVGTAVSGAFVKITTDSKGRVTGTSAVTTADVTSLVDDVYVNVAGDTMAGELLLPATNEETSALAAVTKGYVDAEITSVSGDLQDVINNLQTHTLQKSTADGIARVTVEDEQNVVVTAPGNVTVAADGDISLNAGGSVVLGGEGEAVLESDGDLSIVAGGEFSVEAEQFTLTSGEGKSVTFQLPVDAVSYTLPAHDPVDAGKVLSTDASGVMNWISFTDGAVTDITVTQPEAGLRVTKTGTTGIVNLDFALSNDLAALEALTSNGVAVRVGENSWATREITGAAGQLVVTDGNGVSNNPVVGLAAVSLANEGSFVKVSTDEYGRVSGTTAVTGADIAALADSQYVRRDGTTAMTAALNLAGEKLINVGAPTESTDGVNKNYVDDRLAGLSWKEPVRVATTEAIVLSDVQTIDGIPLTVGDRVLVKNQAGSNAEHPENGIYVVSVGEWSRAVDFDQVPVQEVNSAAVFVMEGSINGDYGFTQMARVVSVGDPMRFTQFSGAAAVQAGIGLVQNGHQIDVSLGAGIVELPEDGVGIDLYAGEAGNALILTTDGTGSDQSGAAQLYLKLASAGGLKQNGNALSLDINSLEAKEVLVAADKFATQAGSVTAADVLSYVKTNVGDLEVDSLTSRSLSAGRVTFAGQDGALVDDESFMFDADGKVLVVGDIVVGDGNIRADEDLHVSGDSVHIRSNVVTQEAAPWHPDDSEDNAIPVRVGSYVLTAGLGVDLGYPGVMSLDLPEGKVVKFEVHVVGRCNSNAASFMFEGVAMQSGLVGRPMETILARPSGLSAAEWQATIAVADGQLVISVTGEEGGEDGVCVAQVKTIEF